MKIKKSRNLFFILIAVIIFLSGVITTLSLSKSLLFSPTPSNYEECIKSPGAKILESYPEQCVTEKGLPFIRELTDEEKRRLETPDLSPTLSNSYPTGWISYKDTQFGITFSYPQDWELNPDSQNFQQGDVISVWIWGETQIEGTEFHDGAYFTVGRPVETELSLTDWLETDFLNESNTSVLEQEPDIREDVTLAGHNAAEVYLCGLGCFTYRFTKIDNQIYGIILFAEGPNKTTYLAQIEQILSSLKISP